MVRFVDRSRGQREGMALLLVDDRDGRVITAVEDPDELQDLLEQLWGGEDVPEYLCLVQFHEHRGALLGTDSTVRVRPLL